MAGRKSSALEMAVIGVIANSPMHGYELRKRLVSVLGLFGTISYGALYPTLRRLVAEGFLIEQQTSTSPAYPVRNRIVYSVTDSGRARLGELLAADSDNLADDEAFSVRFSLFNQTEAATRLRILEGRRSKLQERLDTMRENLHKGRERLDSYTLELQQHGLDALEREVAWLGDFIKRERGAEIVDATTPAVGQLRPRASQPRIISAPPRD